MPSFFSRLRQWLCRSVEPDFRSCPVIRCRRDEISLQSCSNVLLRVKTPEADGYFCESRLHLSAELYLRSMIEDYYALLFEGSDAERDADRRLVLTSLEKPENRKRFFNQGENRIGSSSPCARFIATGDASLVGLDSAGADEACIARLKRFVRDYAWCQLTAYGVHRFTRKGRYQSLVTNRPVAVYALAKAMGAQGLFAPCAYVRLEIEGFRPLFGVFTERAAGVNCMELSRAQRAEAPLPALQRDLNSLHVVDVISCEKDHSPNNYHVLLHQEGPASICVFDNNGISLFPLKRSPVFRSYKDCGPLMNRKGELTLPYLSRPLAEGLLRLSLPTLVGSLRGKLRLLQILFAWLRLRQLQKAIRRSRGRGLRLLEDGDWSPDTVAAELALGQKTYLRSFLTDCCRE